MTVLVSRRRRACGDEGFSLVEVMVALIMLSIVSLSASVLFVHSLKTTSEQSVNQRAISVATRSLETLAAVPVAQLVSGRSQSSVQALLADPRIAALTGQDLPGPQMDPDTTLGTYDPSADATSTPVVPITSTEQLNGTSYAVTTIINQCLLHTDGTGEKVCDRTAATGAKRVYRATVNVTWGKADCGGPCSYSVSELIDQRQDPQFQLADSVPIIQGVTPSSAARNTTQQIMISGADFRDGARLELAAGGGTLTNIVQDARTAKTLITATWTAGPTVGPFTLTVINPDQSRAIFSLAVVPAVAVNDCVDTPDMTGGNGWRRYFTRLLTNDPGGSSGTVTYSNPTGIAGDLYKYNDFVYFWTPNNGVSTVDYTVTVNGYTSNTATVTFRAAAGACS